MADTDGAPAQITGPEDLIGKFVIARCSAAGVHAGTLASLNGEDGATLTGSRRLWRWYAAKGDYLSGVATDGLNHKTSKVGGPIDVALKGVCELILCSDKAATSIAECPSHEPR